MNLIPHIANVQHRILQRIPPEAYDRYQVTTLELEMLPYSLAAAHHFALQVVGTQVRVVNALPDEHLKGTLFHGLDADHQREISFAIDSFLEAARRAQNALIPYLSRAFSIGLASSLSDVVASLQKNKVHLHPVIHDLIVGYWETYGRRLKDYRDVSQHHSLVASDARVFLDSHGQRGLRLLLPSNPEKKSTGQLIYGSPAVHAVPYVKEQLIKLLALSFWITRSILDLVPGATGQVVSVLLREPVILGQGARIEGHRLASLEDMGAYVQAGIDHAHAKYESELAPAIRAQAAGA
jgi:hypothetical protein